MSEKRRGHNEGSIANKPRRDGRWEARLIAEDGTRKVFYGKTRAEAKDKLKKAIHDKQDGTLATGPSQTLAQFLTRWLEDTARHSVRESTFESYLGLVKRHIVPVLGKKRLPKLTAQELQSFYSQKLSEGLSPRTVQYLHAILHRSLEQAVRYGFIARNPADLVDRPKVPRHEIKPLSPKELAHFLEVAKADDDPLYALYVLAVVTGARQGELLGLRWPDIDMETGTLHISQQVRRTNKQFLFSEPKSAKSRRSVALPAFAVEALHVHRGAQLQHRLLIGSDWEPLNLVFPNEFGRPMERQNLLRRSFFPLLEKARLPKIRFHDLRHSAATVLLSQNVHPRIVMERLGHSQISLTMDTYSHVLPDMQREAADKLEKLFGR